MAHPEQREFFRKVQQQYPDFFTAVSVIEIGSLNINGTVRDFFAPAKYVGVDVAPGPGVDVVAEGQDVADPDGSYDIAVSAECFEHNPYWVETFANMHRLASKAVMFTCATDGRAEHGTTRTTPGDSPLTLDWDYYKNLNEADFRAAFELDKMFTAYEFSTNPHSHDLYFYGIK